MKQLIIIISTLFLNSCKAYLDVADNSIANDYMTFKYEKKYNDLNYFSKVNASADKDIFYKTHFCIKLPKDIVNWTILDNKFYFEYSSRQIIYIYTAYKNEGTESKIWEVRDIEPEKASAIIEYYWLKQKRNRENHFSPNKKERITKLYTNGKYNIILFDIKEKNYAAYLESIKSFKVY